MPQIVMQQDFPAAPERVFEATTDHVGFGTWMNTRITLERPGTPAPNGLGAIRAVHARGLRIREEVVRWDAPRAMDYRVIGGAPFERHLGEIRITPRGDGTRLDYRIRFDWPWWAGGALVARLLARELEREISAGLARMAETLR